MTTIQRFLQDEQGQDLVEYTLIVGFITMASAGLFLGVGGDVNSIWSSGSATLQNAAIAVSMADPGPGAGHGSGNNNN